MIKWMPCFNFIFVGSFLIYIEYNVLNLRIIDFKSHGRINRYIDDFMFGVFFFFMFEIFVLV